MARSKAAAKPAAKNKKPRKGYRRFLREVISELKKVSWPNTKELTSYTTIVVVLIIIFAAIVGIIDLGLGKLLTLIS